MKHLKTPLQGIAIFLGFCAAPSFAQGPLSAGQPSAGLPLPAVGTSEDLFQKAQGWVFPLKTALGAQSPKKTYGTAFVIDSSGILATNFHVVADAVHEPEKYQLFLEVPDTQDGQPQGTLSVDLLAFDITHDLALVKVNRTFSGAFSLTSEGDVIPAPGERLWSLGKPLDLKLSMSEGTFNGEITLGDYAEYFLSTQLNPGMSGGPTVDSLGVVRGVNFAIHRKGQNVSFVVPGRFLKKLVNRFAAETQRKKDQGERDIPQGPSERKKDFAREVSRQVAAAGQSLVEALVQGSLPASAGPMVLSESGLRFSAVPPDFRCWQDQKDLSKTQSELFAKKEEAPLLTITQCSSPFQVALADDLPAGDIQLRFAVLKPGVAAGSQGPRTRSDWQRISQQIGSISGGLFKNFFSERSGTQVATGRLGEVCRSVPFRPRGDTLGRTWEARYCVDQYQNYPALKELALRVTGAIPSGESFVMSLEAQAMSMPSALSLAEWAMNGLQWEKPESNIDLDVPSRVPAAVDTGKGVEAEKAQETQK